MNMYQKRDQRRKDKVKKQEQNNSSSVNINWYPGHMAKTLKQIEQDLKLVDIVIEVLDARIPISSQNPEIKRIIKETKKIVILNKSDLADRAENDKWVLYFNQKGIPAILCNSNSGEGLNKIYNEINSLVEDERKQALDKGRVGRIIRLMIIGIPNVGKSSIINRMSKKTTMQVGNKPGVTKNKQWIRLENNIELLDTPGVLWPKLDNSNLALNLAYTGTIKSELLEQTEIAYNLTKYLVKNYKQNLIEKYKLNNNQVEEILNDNQYEENEKIIEIMNLIGKCRGAIAKGGVIDLEKTSKIILDDFKNGKIGRISLEKMEDYK